MPPLAVHCTHTHTITHYRLQQKNRQPSLRELSLTLKINPSLNFVVIKWVDYVRRAHRLGHGLGAGIVAVEEPWSLTAEHRLRGGCHVSTSSSSTAKKTTHTSRHSHPLTSSTAVTRTLTIGGFFFFSNNKVMLDSKNHHHYYHFVLFLHLDLLAHTVSERVTHSPPQLA